MFLRRLAAAALACGLVGAVGIAASGPASAATGDGTVYVVHGVPGATVDVYVNGKKTLPNFAPKTVAGPLALPAGNYDVKIYAAGANPSSAKPVIDKSVDLPAGANASLVAHLNASGSPVLTAFVNDTATAPAGQGRLIVRHTAAAPAVDVLANGKAAFTNLTNPNEAKADLPAGTYSAAVTAAGTTSPALIGPANVPVTAGMATVVYAIGSASDKNLGVVTQQIALAGAQMSVQTGTSGLLDHHTAPLWAIAGFSVALLALTGSGLALARARARS